MSRIDHAHILFHDFEGMFELSKNFLRALDELLENAEGDEEIDLDTLKCGKILNTYAWDVNF